MTYWGAGALFADGAPITVPRGPAHDQAQRELLDPAYHRHDPSLLQQIISWINRQLDKLFSAVGGDGTDHTTAAIGLGVVVAVAVLAALWWRLGAPRRRARSTADLFETSGPRTADDYRAAATAHAAAGAWADAVREQMRGLVRGLEERTLLDTRPGRTADEAAAEAGRALPGQAAALTAGARTFDDIAYGDHEATEAAYHSLLTLDQALRSARPEPAPAGGGAA